MEPWIESQYYATNIPVVLRGAGAVFRPRLVCTQPARCWTRYAYIEFEAEESVELAIELDGKEFKGRTLKVRTTVNLWRVQICWVYQASACCVNRRSAPSERMFPGGGARARAKASGARARARARAADMRQDITPITDVGSDERVCKF